MTDEKETSETGETGSAEEAAEEKAEAADEAAAVEAEAEEEEAGEGEAKPAAEERYTRGQLQQFTAPKLRAIALELGEIVGVHGMKKGELVEAIFALRGLEEADGIAAPAVDKSSIKKEIRELKTIRDSALEAGDAGELKRVRKRIKRLKRALRKVS